MSAEAFGPSLSRVVHEESRTGLEVSPDRYYGSHAKLLSKTFFPQHLYARYHRDAVPRTHLDTESAPNTPRQIDRARLHDLSVIGAGERVNTVDRTDRDTSLAPSAKVFIKKR